MKILIEKDNDDIKGSINGKPFEFKPGESYEVSDELVGALKDTRVKFKVLEVKEEAEEVVEEPVKK